jgi:hypothetical protein
LLDIHFEGLDMRIRSRWRRLVKDNMRHADKIGDNSTRKYNGYFVPGISLKLVINSNLHVSVIASN